VINEDILDSIEFACKLAGTQFLVIMGHTSCAVLAEMKKNKKALIVGAM
jgi:carbonic anhydrase